MKHLLLQRWTWAFPGGTAGLCPTPALLNILNIFLRRAIHPLRHMQPTQAQHAQRERGQRPDVE